LRGVQFPATTLNRLILAVVLACVVLGISRNNVTMWSAAILGGLFAVSAVRFFASQRRKWFMFALSGAGVFFWLLFKFA
jgi:ABC-type Fe3+-siderophore transport system permease subunit